MRVSRVRCTFGLVAKDRDLRGRPRERDKLETKMAKRPLHTSYAVPASASGNGTDLTEDPYGDAVLKILCIFLYHRRFDAPGGT